MDIVPKTADPVTLKELVRTRSGKPGKLEFGIWDSSRNEMRTDHNGPVVGEVTSMDGQYFRVRNRWGCWGTYFIQQLRSIGEPGKEPYYRFELCVEPFNKSNPKEQRRYVLYDKKNDIYIQLYPSLLDSVVSSLGPGSDDPTH
ncbi:MAG: hypothetical protein JSW08_01595 [archaeon]|nr:MAG: hypothetical protein JSW08_01595 [archaeon]